MKRTIMTSRGTRSVDLNPRRAIRKFCQTCSHDSWDHVLSCQLRECRLHPFRRGNLPEGATRACREEAIAVFCLECCRDNQDERGTCKEVRCPLHPFRLG